VKDTEFMRVSGRVGVIIWGSMVTAAMAFVPGVSPPLSLHGAGPPVADRRRCRFGDLTSDTWTTIQILVRPVCWSGCAERVIDARDGRCIAVGADPMRVSVERQGCGGVAQPGLHGLRVDAVREQERRRGVAKVVHPATVVVFRPVHRALPVGPIELAALEGAEQKLVRRPILKKRGDARYVGVPLARGVLRIPGGTALPVLTP